MRRTNKIVVTGLALAADADPEICQVCNFDVSWVFRYPSTLLWADSIIVTPTIMSAIEKRQWSEFPKWQRKPIGDVVRLFFDKAGESGLIAIREPSHDVDDKIKMALRDRVNKDLEALARAFPSAVGLQEGQNVRGEMQIEGHHYCPPRILSIYYSFLLARAWEAEPLLSDYTFTYLKYAFGGHDTSSLISADQSVQTFQEVFHEQLPEIDIHPHLAKRNCWNCGKASGCERADLPQIEKRLAEYLKLRDYDEVDQMRELFAKLSAKARLQSDVDFAEYVRREFQETERKLRRRLHKTFPIATRWTSLVTILSIPVAVAGVTTGSSLVAGIGAGIAGLSEIAKQYMETLVNKHRWLCFRQGNATDADKAR